jgi:hypothetical protein
MQGMVTMVCLRIGGDGYGVMTNYYSSLTIEQLQRSYEEYSPLWVMQIADEKEAAGSDLC